MKSTTETILDRFEELVAENTKLKAVVNGDTYNIKRLSEENEKLKIELQEANDYADRLVEHKDMVCLPADLANLRKANAHFAIENEDLNRECDGWREAAYSLAEAIPASWEELQPPAEQLQKFKEMVAFRNKKTKEFLDNADKHSKMYP